jgi:hypothetical protein
VVLVVLVVLVVPVVQCPVTYSGTAYSSKAVCGRMWHCNVQEKRDTHGQLRNIEGAADEQARIEQEKYGTLEQPCSEGETNYKEPRTRANTRRGVILSSSAWTARQSLIHTPTLLYRVLQRQEQGTTTTSAEEPQSVPWGHKADHSSSE